MTEEQKAQIDGMDYETMLRKWRFGPSIDPIFKGEVGDYFKKELFRKKNLLWSVDAAEISKKVGWEP